MSKMTPIAPFTTAGSIPRMYYNAGNNRWPPKPNNIIFQHNSIHTIGAENRVSSSSSTHTLFSGLVQHPGVCHHCGFKRGPSLLRACTVNTGTNAQGQPMRCPNLFCVTCLRVLGVKDPREMARFMQAEGIGWSCPACRGKCTCAVCKPPTPREESLAQTKSDEKKHKVKCGVSEKRMEKENQAKGEVVEKKELKRKRAKTERQDVEVASKKQLIQALAGIATMKTQTQKHSGSSLSSALSFAFHTPCASRSSSPYSASSRVTSRSDVLPVCATVVSYRSSSPCLVPCSASASSSASSASSSQHNASSSCPSSSAATAASGLALLALFSCSPQLSSASGSHGLSFAFSSTQSSCSAYLSHTTSLTSSSSDIASLSAASLAAAHGNPSTSQPVPACVLSYAPSSPISSSSSSVLPTEHHSLAPECSNPCPSGHHTTQNTGSSSPSSPCLSFSSSPSSTSSSPLSCPSSSLFAPSTIDTHQLSSSSPLLSGLPVSPHHTSSSPSSSYKPCSLALPPFLLPPSQNSVHKEATLAKCTDVEKLKVSGRVYSTKEHTQNQKQDSMHTHSHHEGSVLCGCAQCKAKIELKRRLLRHATTLSRQCKHSLEMMRQKEKMGRQHSTNTNTNSVSNNSIATNRGSSGSKTASNSEGDMTAPQISSSSYLPYSITPHTAVVAPPLCFGDILSLSSLYPAPIPLAASIHPEALTHCPPIPDIHDAVTSSSPSSSSSSPLASDSSSSTHHPVASQSTCMSSTQPESQPQCVPLPAACNPYPVSCYPPMGCDFMPLPAVAYSYDSMPR